MIEGSKTFVVDDLATMAVLLALSETEDFSINGVKLGDGIRLRVKMIGNQWDGKIDYKVAEYVIRLQKAVLSAYNSISGKPPLRYNKTPMDEAQLRVTVTVEEGCLNIEAFAGIIMSWPLFVQVGLATAILIAFTATKYFKIESDADVQKNKDDRKAEIDAKILQTIQAVACNSNDNIKDVCLKKLEMLEDAVEENINNASQMHYLAQKMDKEDKMQINDEDPLTKEQALQRFKPSIKEEETFESAEFIVDGEYEIRDIFRAKDSINVAMSDGKVHKFSMEKLSDEERQILMKKCSSKRNELNKLEPIQLWLTACFHGGVFSGGFVDGVGNLPRKWFKTFTEAQMQSIDDAEKQLEEYAEK